MEKVLEPVQILSSLCIGFVPYVCKIMSIPVVERINCD